MTRNKLEYSIKDGKNEKLTHGRSNIHTYILRVLNRRKQIGVGVGGGEAVVN